MNSQHENLLKDKTEGNLYHEIHFRNALFLGITEESCLVDRVLINYQNY